MNPASSRAIFVLSGLIRACNDGQEGLLDAAEHIRNGELNTQLHAYCVECSKFALELQGIVQELEESVRDNTSSETVPLPGGWLDLNPAVVGPDDDYAVLAECEHYEDVVLAEYKNALENELPDFVREIVEKQFREIRNSHDQVKQLRNAPSLDRI